MHWHARDSAAELARRYVTYQKKPKTSADTGDGPCDEEEEDSPEESEDGIAGRHGDYLVVDLLLLLTCDGMQCWSWGDFERANRRKQATGRLVSGSLCEIFLRFCLFRT